MECLSRITNKTLLSIILFFSMAVVISISGCYNDNEEDLYPGSGGCDTSNVTYSKSVAPVFAGYCNSCHSGNNPSGNLLTDSYASVKTNMSRIHGAINHLSGFSSMPKDGGQLSPCDLATIDIWIRQGMPNN
jgi:hypothetical protein